MSQEVQNTNSRVVEAIKNEDTLIPYVPASTCRPMGSFVPVSLASETIESLERVKTKFGDIPQYISEQLGYSSRISVCEALDAEQADAVASIIYQFENKNGYILADMAGIGKGRVCASILRYAFQKGVIPVFVTVKPNLFSDIYRDISDIGGLKSGAKPYMGNPLILNGFKKNGENSIYQDDKIVVNPPTTKTVSSIINKQEFPEGYDWMLFTYSQFQGGDSEKRRTWLESISDKCIFVFDEAHVVSGNSDMGDFFELIVKTCNNSLFSSATFAKRPENMYIFSHKTDLGKSDLRIDKLLEAIKKGGNKMQEFMASTLVKSGQMIRRERSFDNCGIDYSYMSESLTDWSYDKYDRAVSQFNELAEYAESEIFVTAKKTAVLRFIDGFNNSYEQRLSTALEGITDEEELNEIKNNVVKKIELASGGVPRNKDERKNWFNENHGKYLYDFNAGVSKSELFIFIETLLFSIKADDVYQKTILQLLGKRSPDGAERNLENIDSDGNSFLSERKVIIAVRSTLESVFTKLNMSIGDTLPDNDFRWYFEAMIKKMTVANIRFYKIDRKMHDKFKKHSLPETHIINEYDWEMQSIDFADGMQMINKMREDFVSVPFGMPLSPIDYIVDKIRKTKRPSWDSYGSGNPNYIVEEITGRKFQFSSNGTDYFLGENKKQANASVVFDGFNSGETDVIILNTSGSTGASAHSSSKFKDRRPRAMIIHQAELDVNIEVQKRGRILRTGQVNYPSYVYVVSRIPSELRRLIMLRHKLKSLDANTTANQEQSSKISDIKDANGNSIEDFDNKYGLSLLEEFLSEPSNNYFLQYIGDLFREGEQDENGRDPRSFMKLSVDRYLKNIQLAPSLKQKEFYDTLNSRYIILREHLKANNDWDLETETEDLRAVLKTRVMKVRGDGKTFFGDAVYEEDNYIMKEMNPLSREDVDNLRDELLKGVTADVFVKNLITDVKYFYENEYLKNQIDLLKKPVRTDFSDELEYNLAERAYQQKKSAKEAEVREDLQELLEVINFFKPDKPIKIPANIDDFNIVEDLFNESSVSNRFSFNRGKFVGYKLRVADGKYTRGSIEMVFAQLDNEPKVVFRPTKRFIDALYWMMDNQPNSAEIAFINEWRVDSEQRDIARIITGNILNGYGVANDEMSRNPEKWKAIRFTRFTTNDGNSLRVGIRMIKADPKANLELTPQNAVLITPINSDDVKSAVRNLGYERFIENSESNVFIKNIGSALSGEELTTFYQLVVVLGRPMENDLYTLSPRSPIKKSPLYDDELFLKSSPLLPMERKIVEKRHQWGDGSRRQDKIIKLMAHVVDFADNDEGWGLVKPYLDYAYEKEKIKFELRGSYGVDVYDQKDVYGETTQDVQSSDSKQYKYYPVQPFNMSSKPAEFVRYEKNETSPDGFGVVYLSKIIPPVKAMSYGLAPMELTIPEMFGFYMSQLSEQSQRDAVEEMNKMINSGEKDVRIGNYAVKKLPLGMDVFTFGDLAIYQIGSIFRNYLSGNVSAEISEQSQQELTEEEKQIVEDYEESYSVPINWNSAQDFIILLNHKN